ncbi:MAG TPA: hypothetical protein VMN57_11550 [Anaerolineales bacterium]|nr:hypothetical protein [Anaerolineales bacterium]
MPAVTPARLKREIAALFEVVADADAFERALDDLLDRYADRTYRPSQAGVPGSLLQAYHAARPVLRAVETGLEAFAADAPEDALTLADRLWEKPLFEPRYLAARLLAFLPGIPGAEIVARLERWLPGSEDETLLAELVRAGLSADEAGLIGIVEALLEDGALGYRTALPALGAVVRMASEESLPGVYRLFAKALGDPDADRSARLLNLARGLAERSPVETAYFMRQQFLISSRPEVGRILRQILPLLPTQLRADIRRVMREDQ